MPIETAKVSRYQGLRWGQKRKQEGLWLEGGCRGVKGGMDGEGDTWEEHC